MENDYWKGVDFPSTLVERCFAFKKIPVSNLSVEQLRLLIGQHIGLPYTITKAINVLHENILAEGDYYPGDLLNSLLNLSDEDWKQSENDKYKLIELMRDLPPQNWTLLKSRNGQLFIT